MYCTVQPTNKKLTFSLLSPPKADSVHRVPGQAHPRAAGQVPARPQGRQRRDREHVVSHTFPRFIRRPLPVGAVQRVRLQPDVERAGERVPRAARKYEDRFSQGEGKGTGGRAGWKKGDSYTCYCSSRGPGTVGHYVLEKGGLKTAREGSCSGGGPRRIAGLAAACVRGGKKSNFDQPRFFPSNINVSSIWRVHFFPFQIFLWAWLEVLAIFREEGQKLVSTRRIVCRLASIENRS